MKTALLQKVDLVEIARIGRERQPAEACGVLLPTPFRGSRVWEMPNRASRFNEAFELHTDDIVVQLGEWLGQNRDHWDDLAVWHTHPSGDTTPSKADMEGRFEPMANLVVALTEEGPKPVWF